MRSARRGISLLELLLSLGLLILALIVVQSLVGRSHLWFRQTEARNGAHQEALRCVDRLARELRESDRQSLTATYPSGDPTQGDLALSFLTARNQSGRFGNSDNGRPLYQAYVIYWREPGENALRTLRVDYAPASGDPSTAEPLQAGDVQSVIGPGLGRVVARQVDRFALLDDGGNPTDSTEPPLRLDVGISVVAGSQEHRLDFRHAVRLAH